MNEKKKSNVPMIIGIGCLVVVLLGAVGIGGCIYFVKVAAEKAYDQIGEAFFSQADSEEDRIALQEKFKKVLDANIPLLQKGIFLSIVGNMINDDQKITSEEVTRLHEVMDKCIADGANVDLQQYITGG